MWLLDTLIHAMDNKMPVGIIADSDPSMEGALRLLLPNTVHKLCNWDLERKHHIEPKER